MALIADLPELQTGSTVNGIYRVTSIETRTSANGRPCSVILLKDRTGQMKAYCRKVSQAIGHLTPGQYIDATLSVNHFDQQVMVTLLSAIVISPENINPIRFIPRSSAPRPDIAARMEQLIDWLEFPVIESFIKRVFSQESLVLSFLKLPASRDHHHSWPGGLAEHSLEVAAIAYRASYLDNIEKRYVALTAGLLHDIGKVRTCTDPDTRYRTWQLVRHDELTLETLGPALEKLDSQWPDGGAALRYILQWRGREHDNRPLLPIAMAVRYADQYSAASSSRHIADKGRMPWEKFASLNVRGPKSRFWYPSHAISTKRPERLTADI